MIYPFTFQAYEVENPRKREAFSRVVIDVIDVNDHAPSFIKSSNNFTITENAVKGTIVTRLAATDADEVLVCIIYANEALLSIFHVFMF